MTRSRLFISTYNATTFLESLSQDVPTIMFWNPGLWELRRTAEPYFAALKKVGILHEAPISAAEMVVQVWEDVQAWWRRSAVTEARLRFCERFARSVRDPTGLISKSLLPGETSRAAAARKDSAVGKAGAWDLPS